MEMIVSLSHEIRVARQDNDVEKPPVLEGQQKALEEQERQRMSETYDIDEPKEDIAEKEQKRIEAEEEQAEQNRTKPPEDLGQTKINEEHTATDIQNKHDDLTKL